MDELRTVISSNRPDYLYKIENLLRSSGFHIIGSCDNFAETLRLYQRVSPDIIIIDRDNLKGNVMELLEVVEDRGMTAVIVLSNELVPELIEVEKESWQITQIIKPLDDESLLNSIDVAVSRFKNFLSMQQEIETLKNNLETRKLVERAKSVLMKYDQKSEEQAFRSIQKQSMNKAIPMKDIAEKILNDYQEK